MRMFFKKPQPLPPKIAATLLALREKIAKIESTPDFQEAYQVIPTAQRSGKTFSAIVHKDLIHAFLYAHQSSPAKLLQPEVCRALMEATSGDKLEAHASARTLRQERHKLELYALTEDTPIFLSLFKASQKSDLSNMMPLLKDLKSKWEDVAFALMDATENETFNNNLFAYLNCVDVVLDGLEDRISPAQKAPSSSAAQTASSSTELAVIDPDAGPYKKEALNKLLAQARRKSLPEAAISHLEKELKTLDAIPETSSDYSKNLQPLITLVDLPWHKRSPLPKDIQRTEQRMDETHAGLDKVRSIIIEHLSVQMRTDKPSGTILCLDGAPGVGKTSMANAIAYALERPIVRIALGGMNDSHDLRGHRSTYLGAKAGRIIGGLMSAGVKNPIILLDEIDKIDTTHGNLEATMLEILDPEQNVNFTDHYLDCAFDLSEVMFIATSNDKSKIMPALRDRMEIINLPAYTPDEKLHIAQTHLLPRAMKSCHLSADEFTLSTAMLKTIIADYVHEAGVRSLDRAIKKIARNSVYRLQTGEDSRIDIGTADLSAILGKPRDHKEVLTDEPAVGVVNGLYVGGATGGGLMAFEAIKIPSDRKEFNVAGTGLMQESMKESLSVVTSWLRANAEAPLLKKFKISAYQMHVDAVMDGPKDGPSAGIAITTACVSALTDKPVPHDLAMTGKMSLGGRVLAVGGVMEKLEGALRNGMTTVLIPHANLHDLEDVREEVKRKIRIIPVKTIDEVLAHVFAEKAQHQDKLPRAEPANDNARHLPVLVAQAKPGAPR